jgi:hypothetical protein
MLGPSGSALIRVGARFPPCMKNVSEVPVTLNLPCELVLIFACVAQTHVPSQVSTIPPTHLINFVLSKKFAVMEGSMGRYLISGGGEHLASPGFGQ